MSICLPVHLSSLISQCATFTRQPYLSVQASEPVVFAHSVPSVSLRLSFCVVTHGKLCLPQSWRTILPSWFQSLPCVSTK